MNDNPTAKPNSEKQSIGQKERFEIYKLEYQIAAQRYENIYRAIWQNFSYMAIVAGGVLAFGSGTYSSTRVAFLALLPLVFWFFSTYLPMDHYARNARRRASEIEEILTTNFLGMELTDEYPKEKGKGDDVLRLRAIAEVRHFRDFGQDDPHLHWGKKQWRWRSFPFHVNQIVIPVGALVTILAVILLKASWGDAGRKPSPAPLVIRADSTLVAQIGTLSIRLQDLQVQNAKADTVLRTILSCIRRRPQARC